MPPTLQQPLQVINNGSFLDDPSAEPVRTSFEKTKINFTNIWSMLDNQGYQKIFLNLNGIDTTQNEMKYIAEAIERGANVAGNWGGIFTVAPKGRKPIFYTSTPIFESGGGVGISSPKYEYRFYRVHKKGQAFGGNGGVHITSADVSPAGSFKVGSDDNPSSSDFYINLGNIGTSNVWTAFNLGKPSPDLGDPWFIEGISLVSATQNGVSKTWSFTGNDRLELDDGLWGGSDVTNPNYLEAQDEDFDLLSNQPVVYPDLFITKSSKNYKYIAINSMAINRLNITPESTSFSVESLSGTSILGGFTSSSIYDGMDIYIRNEGVLSVTIQHNEGTLPFYIKTGNNLILNQLDIFHFKYNELENRVEFVGVLDQGNKPVPFGNLRILKIESNSNNNILEAGDRVVSSNLNDDIFLSMGVYVSGDAMELSSYDPLSVDYYDPNNP